MVLQNISSRFFIAFIQLFITVIIFCLLPEGIIKPILLILWWIISFQRISRNELILFTFCALFFPFLNILAVHNGNFTFLERNIFSVPYYEFLLWGFYFLYAQRTMQLVPPQTIPPQTFFFILLFFLAFFGSGESAQIITLTTSAVLILVLFFFHAKEDLVSISFFLLLGLLIEYSGVLLNQWIYTADIWNVFGVPLWLIPFWCGLGFLFYRVILPVYQRII